MVEAVVVMTTLAVLLFGIFRVGAAALAAQQRADDERLRRWQARMEAADAW